MSCSLLEHDNTTRKKLKPSHSNLHIYQSLLQQTLVPQHDFPSTEK